MPSIAGDYPRARLAYHACQDQHCRPVAVLAGKLLQTGCIAINDGSGRNAMDEPSPAEAFEGKRARERRRSGSDHFRHPRATALDLAHNFHHASLATVTYLLPPS